MSRYTKPDQGLNFSIPSDGQVFTAVGDTGRGVPGTLWIRKGNTIQSLDLQQFGKKYSKSGNGWTLREVAKRELAKQGVYVNKAPRFNLGDIVRIFHRTSIQSLAPFKNPVIKNPNEVITEKRSTTNPYANDITSSTAGVVSKAPALSALAQQAQAQGLQTQAPKNLTQVRAPVAPTALPTPKKNETFDINKFNQAIANGNIAQARSIGQLPAVTPATVNNSITDATQVATKAAQVAGLPTFQPGATVNNGVSTPTPVGTAQVKSVTQAPVGSQQARNDLINNSTQVATQAAQVAGLPDFKPGAVVDPTTGLASVTPTGDQLLQKRLAEAVKSSRPANSTSISTASIATPQTKINVPTPTQPVAPVTSDLNKIVEDVNKMFTSTQADQNLKTQQDQLAALTGQAGKIEQTRAQLEQAQGIDAKQQNLKNLSDQLASLNAQAQQASATAQDRLAPTFAIAGEQAAVERQRAVKALTIGAQIKAVQGNITLAMDLVDRAIKAQYEPIDSQIKIKKIQLQNALDAVRRQDTKQSRVMAIALTEQQRILAQQERAVAEKKTQTKDIHVVALQAAQNGANAQEVQQILNSNDFNSAMTQATPFLKKSSAQNGFTLGTGQRRFDANGNLIASGVSKTPTSTSTTPKVSSTQLKQFINKQIASSAFKALTQQEQVDYIRSQGGDPYNFGF